MMESNEPVGVPPTVARAVERALGARQIDFVVFTAGASRRTFLVRHGSRRWVARVAQAPGEELRRAVAAQQMALAAGVRAPHILAQHLAPESPGGYLWAVEEFVWGTPFDHRGFDREGTRRASVDLGRQLRLLHAIPLDAFGLVPPRPYEVYATFAEWIANQERRVPAALRVSGHSLDLIPSISKVYHLLRDTYAAAPRLIKSDCQGDNVLVADGAVTALIDWEWASGADPTFEVAYWLFRSAASAALDYILAGYQPDDPGLFRRRVMAYQVLHALDQMLVFDEYRDTMSTEDFREAIAYCSHRLAQSLKTRPWQMARGD
ncbi:MAG TPA: phosphotransferase [Herpetosiphonaceae bacterium]|nr:phosphotransferase [Herpetosiphonaceae bacterium]